MRATPLAAAVRLPGREDDAVGRPARRDGGRIRRWAVSLVLIALAGPAAVSAQDPEGLARAALEDTAFTWLREDVTHLRVHFLAGSYPAAHRDSLVRLTAEARSYGLALLGEDEFASPIDVFFIESRAQMEALTGVPVTGFAHRDARAVFLVTNPDWRAFGHHELMHVLAHHLWGPASGAWVEEGLAQFADGRCGGYTIDSVAHALARQNGAVPFDTLVGRFRELNDLTAYLQASSLVGYLYDVHGREAVRAAWRDGPAGLAEFSVEDPDAAWSDWVAGRARPVPPADLASIERKGCG